MSTKNSNKLNIPEAKAAMEQFKMEAASEVGVNLKNGYNGHLTSREDSFLRRRKTGSRRSFLLYSTTSVPLFTSMR